MVNRLRSVWLTILCAIVAAAAVAQPAEAEPPSAIVTGHVAMPDGRSAEGVTVTFRCQDAEVLTARVGADGDYRAAADRVTTCVAFAGGYSGYHFRHSGWTGGRHVVLRPGVTLEGIDFRGTADRSLTGRVLNPDGTPHAYASVYLYQDVDGASSVTAVDTDVQGVFATDRLQPGGVRVQVYPAPGTRDIPAQWYSPDGSWSDAYAVEVPESGPSPDLVIPLKVGGSVEGNAVTGAGSKVGSVTLVRADGTAGITVEPAEADGHYTFAGVAPGDYRVMFRAPGWATKWFGGTFDPATATTITVGWGTKTTDVDAILGPAGTIEVTTLSPDGTTTCESSWEPLAAARTSLGSPGSTPGSCLKRSDLPVGLPIYIAANRTVSNHPYVGQYWAGLTDTTTNPAEASWQAVAAGTTTKVTMRLTQGAQITGRVLGADGTPANYLPVRAWVDDYTLAARETLTEADGTFTLRGLLPGAYYVAVLGSRSQFTDVYFATGTKPAAPNVVVSGTSTTSGIDITLATRFTDVQPTYPFATYIEWLADRGISTGWRYTGGTADFRPTSAVSREAMAAFLARDIAAPGYTPPVSARFSDVPTSYPFYSYVAWLADQGISTGYADGTFKPTDPVTREAMAAFLYRAAGSPAYTPPVTPRFSDVPASHPFYKQISWLAAQGISTGYADGTFKPTDPVTREAMAAFLYRADAVLRRVR